MTATLDSPVTVQSETVKAELPGRAGTWVEVLPHLDAKFGGVSAVVPQLGSSLAARENYNITLAAFCPGDEITDAIHSHGVLLTTWPSSRLTWSSNRDLQRRFAEMLVRADGAHIHGLWDSSTSVSARTARKLGKPYVLSAHGMLEPWALANKGLKKRVYSALIERANVEGAACLHALTRAEANDYRRFGSKRPIAVIPNGVEIPSEVDKDLFLGMYPALRGKRILLFLGRIHFKKGLDLLIEAWAALASRFPDAVLVLAGPDAENSQAAIERKINLQSIEDRVVFTGMLDAETKWSALAAACCFVLPSYSEGLSVAALEAMGMGLPVILSTHCHLPEVAERGAGFVIPAELQELHDALEAVLTNDEQTNVEIGRLGIALVRERFSWPVVASRMAQLYSWVQGGALPRDVELLQVPA